MSSYDPYEREYPRRYVREERREERIDPRYLDTRDYRTSNRDLVPREPRREDSDLSVEEVRREFPPPHGHVISRARSAEPSYYDDDYYYDDYRRDRGHDRRPRRGADSRSSSYYEEREGRRAKGKSGMSKEEKIMAAVAGAALLAGGKEFYDRREAKQDGNSEVKRNALSSVALAGAGALAAYQGAEYYSKHQAKKDQKATYILHRGHDGHVSEYYSDEDEDGRDKKSSKNFLESAIAASGLGAAVKSLTGGGDKSDKGSRSRSRSRSRGGGGGGGGANNKMQKAAMASLLAGATEAFRVSKEPGSWKGEKAKRIVTAAAGAATVDAAQDREHGKLGLMESVIGGLVGNRLINGSKGDIEEDKRTGRSRSRSRARSTKDGGNSGQGLAALATAGLGAFGAKKAYDAHQSRSRSRRGSFDSRDGSPDRRRSRSRSRSVVDKARNSLAKLGIGSGAGALAASEDDDRRRTQDDFDDRSVSRRSRRYSDDMYDDDYRSRRSGRDRDYYEDERDYRRRDRRGGRSDYGSDTDLGDSSEDEKRAKKMKGKQVITTGLAAVATIHAAHGVYQSMEKRNVRQKAVKEGRLSPVEARKLRSKAMMQDAASVGIAAMGVKGAWDELKEARNTTEECRQFQNEKNIRREKRRQRRKQLQDGSGRRRADSWAAPPSRRHYEDDYASDYEDDYYPAYDEPRYHDGNPYRSNTLPAPPASVRR